MMPQDPMVARVVRRFVARQAGYNEKPATKKERIAETIRKVTGIGKGIAWDIADAIVRKHGDVKEILRLALQKAWPVEEDADGHPILQGSAGTLDLAEVAS